MFEKYRKNEKTKTLLKFDEVNLDGAVQKELLESKNIYKQGRKNTYSYV